MANLLVKKYQTLTLTLLLFALTFAVYTFSHRGGDPYNYFVLLSDAFLHGRLNLLINPPWLNELVTFDNKFYVVYPPMPAILMMPMVAIFGTQFFQPTLSIFLSAVNVALCFLVLKKRFSSAISFLVAILYAFGTMQYFHGSVGSVWYVAHIVAMFFIWLALLEALTKKRLFLIGLFIGCAYLSRLPAIFTLVFPLIFLQPEFITIENRRLKIYLKSFVILGLGLLPGVLFNAWYNWARFGVIYDVSYTLLPVFNEPWYKYGLLSFFYIPGHLKEIFTALPVIKPNPPYVVPSINVMALWIVTPAFLLILFARFRQRLILASALAALAISLPGLMHGENGFTQFGFRFALDYLPFLLILIASGTRGKINWWVMLLIIVSILINLWGVIMISFLNLGSF